MRIIIHDLKSNELEILLPNIDENTTIISDNGTIHHCIGCFGCWIKTPGVCVLKDSYQNMGSLFSKCDELIIISKCYYGSYSPFVRNIFDRSIPYILPYFETRNGETHHQKRYQNAFDFSVYFYGEHISEQEKLTAEALVTANGINFSNGKYSVHFYQRFNDIGEVIQ